MAKYALHEYTRDKNGVLKSTLVDAETGETISAKDKAQYTVISQTDYDILKTTGKLPTNPNTNPDNADPNQKQKITPPDQMIYTRHERADDRGDKNLSKASGSLFGSAGPADNYGYKHKPGLVQAASFLPGIPGIAGKALNVGWNAKNISAVKAAQKSLGITPEEQSNMQALKDVISGPSGKLGNMSIGDKKYSVSLDKNDFSSLTPSEAVHRREGLAKLGQLQKEAQTATNNAKQKLHPELDFSQPIVADNKTNTKAGYKESYGKHRPNRPSQDIISAVQDSVGRVFGPEYTAVGTSGEGEYGSSRHRKETGAHALDFHVEDPNGNIVSDKKQMEDLAVDFAANHPEAGIGYDKGYMGASTMHLDLSGQGGVWGAGKHTKGMDPGLRQRIAEARANPVSVSNVQVAKDTTPNGLGLGFMGQPNNPAKAAQTASMEHQYESYIRDAAVKRGIDPEVAVRVAKTEGLQPGTWQSTVPTKTGFEKSFGPFQLNTDAGLGFAMQKAWGLDAADPNNAFSGIDYALDHAAKNGWGAFHGALNNGISNWEGIGNTAKAIGRDVFGETKDSFTSDFGKYSFGYFSKAAVEKSFDDAAQKASQNNAGANRPATHEGFNSNNFGRNDTPSSGRSSGFGSSFGGNSNTNNSHLNSGNNNSIGSGFTGRSFGTGNTNTNTNNHTVGGNTNSLGGVGNSFGGNSNTNNHSNDNNNDNEGATGRFGSSSFGGPR